MQKQEDGGPPLPDHIEASIQLIADLDAEHQRGATLTERVVSEVTDVLARPLCLGVVTAFVFGWIAFNVAGPAFGVVPLDPPPFFSLSAAASVLSLYLVLLVIGTQRRDDQLAGLREQLTLQLTLLSERKLTKLIQLLEEARRDNPLIPNRVDSQAEDMARTGDSSSVLEVIKKSAFSDS